MKAKKLRLPLYSITLGMVLFLVTGSQAISESDSKPACSGNILEDNQSFTITNSTCAASSTQAATECRNKYVAVMTACVESSSCIGQGGLGPNKECTTITICEPDHKCKGVEMSPNCQDVGGNALVTCPQKATSSCSPKTSPYTVKCEDGKWDRYCSPAEECDPTAGNDGGWQCSFANTTGPCKNSNSCKCENCKCVQKYGVVPPRKTNI
jgi:hypothetical protein